MTAPAVTIGIATYNRAHIWRMGRLIDMLRHQTDQDFELLVADDNSTDDTLAVLQDLLPAVNARCRLFHCTAPKRLATQADALPQNILIHHARGETYFHIDDDGWIELGAVAYLRALALPDAHQVVYGQIVMIDPVTHEILWTDQRLDLFAKRPPGCHPCPAEKALECGCIWAAPTRLLRHMGGHDMVDAAYRASDRRLGTRFSRLVRTAFVTDPALRFWHLGRAWSNQVPSTSPEYLAVARNPLRTPNCRLDTIANGGAAFWSSGALDPLYREITIGS